MPAGSPPPRRRQPTAEAGATTPRKAADGDAKAGLQAGGRRPTRRAVKDQAYWAGRLKALQDALSRDQTYADAMQTRINALTTDFVNRDDPAQRAVIETRSPEGARRARSPEQERRRTTKKAIADLEEEARRAGVPPGWLR